MSTAPALSSCEDPMSAENQETAVVAPPAPTSPAEDSTRRRSRIQQPVRGKLVSGRDWKTPKEKFSKMITTPNYRQSWEKKQEQRERLKALKDREREAKAVRDNERQAQIERIKKNRERREANAIKSASYQVVKNTSKLKKLSKKDFQQYKKLADINK